MKLLSYGREMNIFFFFYRNEHLREKLRDMEDRSRPDNLRIDDLKEVVNETLEQAKEILKRMISE